MSYSPGLQALIASVLFCIMAVGKRQTKSSDNTGCQ